MKSGQDRAEIVFQDSRERVVLRVQAAHQPREGRAALRAFPGQPESRGQERFQNLFYRGRFGAGLLLITGEHLQTFAIYRRGPAYDHRLQKILLGMKVIMNRRKVHACLGDHLAERRGGVAVLGEEAFGCVKNTCFRVGRASHSVECLNCTTDLLNLASRKANFFYDRRLAEEGAMRQPTAAASRGSSAREAAIPSLPRPETKRGRRYGMLCPGKETTSYGTKESY